MIAEFPPPHIFDTAMIIYSLSFQISIQFSAPPPPAIERRRFPMRRAAAIERLRPLNQMKNSYIFLASSYRNRNKYPQSTDYLAPFQYPSITSASNHADYVSNSTPLFNINLDIVYDEIVNSTLVITGNSWYYEWPALVVTPASASTVSSFVIQISTSYIFSAQLLLKLLFIYNTIRIPIIAARHASGQFYSITISTPIDFDPVLTQFAVVQTPILSFQQTLFPNIYADASLGTAVNELVGLYLLDVSQNLSHLITEFDSTTNVITAPTLTSPLRSFILTSTPSRALYQVIAIVNSSTLEVTNIFNNIISLPLLQYTYMYHVRTSQTIRLSTVTVSSPTTYDLVLKTSDTAAFIVGDYIDILLFTRDNLVPYSTLIRTEQPMCYELQCISLMIPNSLVSNSYGTRLGSYPYVLVELRWDTNAENYRHVAFITNDKNIGLAQFICPMRGICGEAFSRFMRIDGSTERQIVWMDPNSSIHVRILAPDGEVITYVVTDHMEPAAPNPYIQTYLLLRRRKISGLLLPR